MKEWMEENTQEKVHRHLRRKFIYKANFFACFHKMQDECIQRELSEKESQGEIFPVVSKQVFLVFGALLWIGKLNTVVRIYFVPKFKKARVKARRCSL